MSEYGKYLKPVIYIGGRYSDGGKLSEAEMQANRTVMRYHAIQFMKKGWAVICPIENDEWAYDDGVIDYDDTLESDLAIIKKCDAVFFCPDWEKSKGAVVEYKFATEHMIPILYEVDGPANITIQVQEDRPVESIALDFVVEKPDVLVPQDSSTIGENRRHRDHPPQGYED